jgi:hypothetical protein
MLRNYVLIPSKIITVRKNQPQWLTSNIRKLIRKKNRIHRKARRSNSPSDWNKFRRIRNDVANLVRKSKEHKNNLIKKLINENSSGSNWWKTSHYILHCSRFADIRQELILSISNIPVNITINLLLFGTNELTDEQNTLIFVSIQKYIIKSKRFTP